MISHYKIRQFVIVVNLVFLVMSIALFVSSVDRSLASHGNEGWRKAQVVTKDIEVKLQETAGNVVKNRLMISRNRQVEGQVLS